MIRSVVMKFGGTSVSSPDRIRLAASKVARHFREGKNVVAVVSAPGTMTDELLDLAGKIHEKPSGRELDMLLATGEQISIALLAMALESQGLRACSLTGAQAGIMATPNHTQAKIITIHSRRIEQLLRRRVIAVVAGFQGLNNRGDISTLGRGGSDLTAVALAAALKADHCEIYTDVEGIYTADPRLVPLANKIKTIGYEAMLELASSGAQVMQPRALEVAGRFDVAIHVKCSFSNEEGTWIMNPKKNAMESELISGIALDRNLSKMTIVRVPDKPGIAAKIFSVLARNQIPVDMIIQSAARKDGTNDISLTVGRNHSKHAYGALHEAMREVGALQITMDNACAKISVVGTGLRHDAQIAATIFETLAGHHINIHMIANSDIKISCVISEGHGAAAVKSLHDVFGLSRGRRPAKA
ncbi:MAG: aspartate kinase [Elusimicrobia bacterium]|nr:aspartate kinase [Elusimicrobiota bacterium]